ncbi:MAG: S1C family serine protease [Candidatus Hydrogenedens sp.]
MQKNIFISIITLLFILIFYTPPAISQDSISDSRRNAIVTAVEKASPAVVTINVVEYQSDDLDPFFELFGFPIRRQQISSIGSGFIFDEAGYILTNYHVLENASKINSVTLSSGEKLDVEFIGADPRTDIAVLKASGKNFPYIPLGDSDNLYIGEWVIAIGNPFGSLMKDPRPTVSVGVVSAVHRKVSRNVSGDTRLYQDLIQTDAAINPGNSGGPLVNSQGKVIGINTMIFSKTGGYQGLSFAIPINRVRRVAEELIKFGKRRDPWFGFKTESLDSIDSRLLRELGIRVDKGVFVTRILKESPAYQAGLRPGDVIIEINRQPVEDPSDVDFINWDLFIGDSVEMKVFREGKILNMKFTIREVDGK